MMEQFERANGIETGDGTSDEDVADGVKDQYDRPGSAEADEEQTDGEGNDEIDLDII